MKMDGRDRSAARAVRKISEINRSTFNKMKQFSVSLNKFLLMQNILIKNKGNAEIGEISQNRIGEPQGSRDKHPEAPDKGD